MLAYSRTEIHNDDVVPHAQRCWLELKIFLPRRITIATVNLIIHYLCLCVYDECNLDASSSPISCTHIYKYITVSRDKINIVKKKIKNLYRLKENILRL